MSSRKRKLPADETGIAPVAALAAPGQNIASTVGAPPSSRKSTTTEADSYFRNLYSSEPSFRELAKKDPAFASVLKDNGQLDFTDPAAVMQLTKTLLMQDFGLKVELPEDRLCPPIPNRHNYILWLKDLLDTTSYEAPGRKLHGVDIGTGASCIYPLLGVVQRQWCFVATDIDSKSLEYAKRNVQINGLEDRITVMPRKKTDPLIPLEGLGTQQLDFVMMNPPFYSSEDEMLSSAKDKAAPPSSVCTGAPVEMVCDGGEVAYVGRMVQESLQLRDQVQWYTAMLGKATSLEVLVEQLRQNNIDNFAVTEFIQGNKTRRWALAWSFRPMRPAESVARGIKASHWRKLLPVPSTIGLFTSQSETIAGQLVKTIVDTVGSLELMSWNWEMDMSRGTGRASGNVWSRAWRRKRLREAKEHGAMEATSAQGAEHCQFGFLISIEVGKQQTTASLRWVEGHDQAIFESFGGFLQGKLKDLGAKT